MWRASALVMLLAARAIAAPAPPVAIRGQHLADSALAAPVITGPRAFALFAGHPAQIRIAWNPVASATHYRVTWEGVAHDLTETAFAITEASPGLRPLAIAAIDKAGRASADSTIQIDVVPIVAVAPGTTESAQSTAYAIGTRFSSPGTTCSLGGAPAAQEVQAITAGRQWLACGAYSAPVIIAPVILATEAIAIPRGSTRTVHVTIASVAPLGERLDIESIGELDLGEAQRTTGGFDLAVTPRANSTTVGLRLVAGALQLGTVDLPLAEPIAIAQPPPERPSWRAFDVGAFAGLFAPEHTGVAATNIGHPTAAGDAVGDGGSLTLHAGWFPIPRAGLEGQVGVAPTAYAANGGTSVMLVDRLQLAIRAVEDRRYGIRVMFGADLLTELVQKRTSQSTTEGGIHYGAAFTVEIARDLALRVEAMHLITSSREAGYASSFIAQLGVVMRLGRRDRW